MRASLRCACLYGTRARLLLTTCDLLSAADGLHAALPADASRTGLLLATDRDLQPTACDLPRILRQLRQSPARELSEPLVIPIPSS